MYCTPVYPVKSSVLRDTKTDIVSNLTTRKIDIFKNVEARETPSELERGKLQTSSEL